MNEGAEQIVQAQAYLKAYLKVLTVLTAAAKLAVETLIDVASALIGAVPAVILAIAEQRLSHAAPTATQELR